MLAYLLTVLAFALQQTGTSVFVCVCECETVSTMIVLMIVRFVRFHSYEGSIRPPAGLIH